MSSPRATRIAIVVLALVSAALMLMLLSPFVPALLLAAMASAALWPWQDALTRRLGGRRGLAATLLVVGLALAAFVPVTVLAISAGRAAPQAVRFVDEALDSPRLDRLFARAGLDTTWLRVARTGDLGAVSGFGTGPMVTVAQAGGKALGALTRSTGAALVQLGLMLVLLFVFLRDGSRLVEWLDRMLPLKAGLFRELLEQFRRVAVSLVASILGTAGVQTLAATVGYLIAGVPHAVFFAFVTLVIALVPLLGATVVSLAMGAALLLQGKIGPGLFLVVWSVLVVGTVDNLVRPLIMRAGVRIPTVVLFFSFLGGLAVFGAIGVFLGPLVVTFFLAMMRIAQREFSRGAVVPDAHPAPRPPAGAA